MKLHTAYIALGSNLGNPYQNCITASEKIAAHKNISLISSSPWYKSKALTLDEIAQADYCNGVLSVQTRLGPTELLRELREIEKEMGRLEKQKKWASRIIDLDIILFDDLIFKTDELEIPHPEMHKRLFVLEPLCKLAPDARHPVFGKTCQHLLNDYSAANPHENLVCWSEHTCHFC
ncbi:MAG: 2-amino-4-hydroxy-6-hydroxymethyldihydropteridine diphosphokinase [Deltaproteobacteria bacterium CG_4_10_14_0_2_um_filter_43_8]|nr:MAG: 2-amino-4-hydroxy-6-hydroxymethyldihydropteridine diphosphokinase [Deltaproteobacteria bacterium CG11_big_fil_rev_8_21_14_0_20_42_23]PJA19562.1 MAG: 2-amino-4-hydroxy-6-hydroxymethyldihydropteridine diphosphokinase [Deltaproteobacteria bacterium CG_4_10_14_0_2_um_filter_43_8]PJC63937.1 MAG: 2-amino-4-hydroxy-6-hydroxymethyldihydropteridine diphosphokinase [Deltaproteobacteria bacterium CG_4_9_14_0_2_um_filter_42_21]